MPNPTQQPPEFQPANFTQSGPFSQYLQQPAQQQVQATQSGGQRFSGREGALGQGAGILTHWINGASAGKARALAERHELEMQNANHINQYRKMVSESDLHEDDKKELMTKADSLEHQLVNDEIVTAGKKNPFMKALGVVHQTLMGGPPVDEVKDPITGETYKRQIGTIHPQQIRELYDNFHSKPSEGTLRTAASQNLYKQVTDAYNDAMAARKQSGQVGDVSPFEFFRQRPDLMRMSDEFEQKYKFQSPIKSFLSMVAPPPSALQQLQLQQWSTVNNAFSPQTQQQQQQPQQVAAAAPPPSATQVEQPNASPASGYVKYATDPNGNQYGHDGQGWVDLRTGQRAQ